MTIETTQILKADEGKILRSKKDPDIQTPSVWLRIGESMDDWEEIDMPPVVEEPEDIFDGPDEGEAEQGLQP